jgi:alkylation response protein AidB-like acyl-CoA dehydrogenase
VELPLSSVVGEVNGGWAVASRQTTHERTAVGGGSPYTTVPRTGTNENPDPRRFVAPSTIIDLARRTGRSGESRVRELIAEQRVIDRVGQQLTDRIMSGMRTGQVPVTAGAILRMYSGESATRRSEIAVEIAGSHAITDAPGSDLLIGTTFLFRQASSIAGGTVEVSRNVVSERVLNMPREFAADRDLPFNQVRQSTG